MAFGTINNSLATGIPLIEGGTGATTASAAATNLGLGTGNSPTFTGATLSGITLGSVLFAGTAGVLSQDNANLFWDDTNNRLGIGTASPTTRLHAAVDDSSNASTTYLLTLDHTTSGTPTAGIGAGISFRTENSTPAIFESGRIENILTTVTAGGERSAMVLSILGASGMTARLRASAAGVKVGIAGTSNTTHTFEVVQAALTSATFGNLLLATGGAHTALTAAETIDVDFNLNRTVQFTTGAAITTQRAFLIQAPTYSATAATQTITRAATLTINGEPAAGTNLTITEGFAFDVSGRTSFYADKPTGSASSYEANVFTTELGAGTQSSEMQSISGVIRTNGSAITSQPTFGSTGTGVHASTGTAIELNGVGGFAYGSGAAVALGTITGAWGVSGQVGYENDNGFPASGNITDGNALVAANPVGTLSGAGARTITNARGLFVFNQGADGITNAIGIDIEAQSGASGLNIGLRTASRILESQGADVASGSTITLGNGGNTFEITGTTAIDLISNVGWQNGSIITLVFNASVTVNQNTATSGNNITILLNGAAGANFAATANDTLTLVLSENTVTGQAWREIGRAVILS